MTRTTVTLLGAALAAALGLAACSSSAPAAPAASSAVTDTAGSAGTATAPTTSATSATPGTAGSVDGSALAQRVVAAMKNAKTGKATLTTTAAGMSFDGTSSFVMTGPDTIDSSGTSTVGQMNLEVRQVGQSLYVRGFPPELTGGKPWAQFDPKGTDPLSQQLREATTNGPNQLVEQLKGTTARVVSSSGGTTVYEIEGLSVQGLPGATMQLTVDDQNRPVSSVVSAKDVQVKVAYADWGAPVTVERPPADQVGTLALPAGGTPTA